MTAVAVPEDPGVEWGGIDAADFRCGECGRYHANRTQDDAILAHRSPREEWVGAWETSREAHR